GTRQRLLKLAGVLVRLCAVSKCRHCRPRLNLPDVAGSSGMTITIGVLALQGAFAEHTRMLAQLEDPTREVRTVVDLAIVDALIIPGGESTTIGKLIRIGGLDHLIRQRASDGMPVWGTCAGMILLGSDVGDSGSKVGEPQLLLGLMDIRV